MNNLFPIEKGLEITPETRPLTQTGSIQVFLQLAEPNLFVQGFEAHEYQERPPTLLRGSLVIRVLKVSKIKSISLTFKGVSRTEWPEGIPPKRQDYIEENDIVNHTWPFYNHSNDNNQSGADIVKNTNPSDSSLSLDDMSSLNLDNSSSIMSSTNAFNIIKRATSPSPAGRHRSGSLLASLKATATNTSTNDSSTTNSNNSHSSDHHFIFHPGDYIYNFEHAIPASTPESIDATFGSVHYSLSVLIERIGAFKSNISTILPIRIIRSQGEESVEDSEPIAISRDWEDQLHYDIVIATKAIILNAYVPVAFKLVPLDKIKLHRIRIYLTENLEYYCRNKKVHRMEPVKKYMLLEHKAPPPPDLPPDADAKAKKMGNLLTSDGYDVTAKEFEFQVYVPQKLNNRQVLHPNTSYVNIKSHHWIKICLRLSRLVDGKPKHYEISIDSPIHVLHPLCAHANTLLPAYGVSDGNGAINYNNLNGDGTTTDLSPPVHDSNVYFPKEILESSPPLSPEVEPIGGGINGAGHHSSTSNSLQNALNQSGRNSRSRSTSTIGNRSVGNFESTLSANVYKPDNLDIELTSPQAQPVSPSFSPASRPIHLIRRPSFEPPPFEADISPPPMRDLLNEGVQGLDAAVLDNAPKDPPSYNDYLEEEAKSPGPHSRYFEENHQHDPHHHQKPPKFTFTNSTPSPPQSPTTIIPTAANNNNDHDVEDERTPRQLRKSDAKSNDEDDEGDEGDIAGTFRFRGSSPNMPASVGRRGTSPESLRIRSSARSGRSPSGRSPSPRTSTDMRSVGSFNSSNSTLPHTNSQQNEIDNIIRQSDSTSSELVSNNGGGDDDEAQEDQLYQPQQSKSKSRLNNQRDERNLSRSSTSSMSPNSLRSLQIDSENEIVDMEPLLHSTTTNTSFNPPFSSSYQDSTNRRPSAYRAPSIYEQYQSRESLGLINESSSVDITALCSNNDSANNTMWHPLTDETVPKRSYTPNAVDTGKVLNTFKNNFHQPPIFKRNMSFGVQSTNPILSTLDDEGNSTTNNNNINNHNGEHVPSLQPHTPGSEESSLKDNQSSSTLTSGNVNDEIINKHLNHQEHQFLANDDEQVR